MQNTAHHRKIGTHEAKGNSLGLFFIQLISKISLKGWHCGSIDNAVVAESLTPVLIFMNKFYNFKGSGIKIVDESMIQ